MSGYDDFQKCFNCGSDNEVKVTDSIACTVCEVETHCTVCGFKAFWGYGYYYIEPQDKQLMWTWI